MDTSDIIATLSALVAGVSAIIAWRAAREARKANLISLHPSKITIYSAFCALHGAINRAGTAVAYSDVVAFYRASQEAEFFFSNTTLVEQISRYFNVCFELAEEHRKLSRPGLTEQQMSAIHEKQDSLMKTELELAAVITEALKEDIRSALGKSGKVLFNSVL